MPQLPSFFAWLCDYLKRGYICVCMYVRTRMWEREGERVSEKHARETHVDPYCTVFDISLDIERSTLTSVTQHTQNIHALRDQTIAGHS